MDECNQEVTDGKVKIRLDLSGCLDTVVALKPTKRAQTIALLIVDAGL